MAYVKNNWVDREGTTRYFETVDSDGAKIFTPDYTQVTELGTPVNADNMNHIEEGIAAGSFTKYDSMATYAKNDLVTTIVDNELKVYKSLQDNNKNALEDSSCWEEVEFSGGSNAGLQLFDTILKDHVLTYEESKGLALQGTYVYKDAVAGSRYGYADFYNKCLEEYQNSSNTWMQPILSANGVLGGNSFAVSGTSTDNTYPAFKAFDGDSTGDWVSASANENLIIYNPIPIKITRIDIVNRNASTVRYIKSGTIYGSNDNSQYDEIATFTNSVTTQLGEWFIDLSVNTKHYKYYKLSMVGETYCSANQITITATELYRKHSNGHIFYDISVKGLVDDDFATTGMAWFYGIDTENERVFLPRNKYFAIKGVQDSVSVVGTGYGLGLTTGTHPNVYIAQNEIQSSETHAVSIFNNGGTAKKVGTSAGSYISNNGDLTIGVTTNPDLSGVVANTSDVLQLDDSKYLYICVGNTESQSTITDVVDVTTTENDTTPLFTGMYFDFKPNNVSWLKAGEQKNSEGVYTFCYNELVNELTTPKYNLKVINEADMIAGIDYSEYWKVNQDNMTFTTPTAISNKALSGAVVGNGMTLGLFVADSDYDNAGLVNRFASTPGARLGASGNAYGTEAGTTLSNLGFADEDNKTVGITTDPTKSGIIAEQSTAQLYFKVANAVQNLELLDAGEVMESLADKISRQDCPAYITETYVNGTSWYRVYSDGWCEQGGNAFGGTTSAGKSISLLKPYADTNYGLTFGIGYSYTSAPSACVNANKKYTNSFLVITSRTSDASSGYTDVQFDWVARGYIA